MDSKQLTCLHTHTEYCDGEGTIEDYCAAAAEKGLSAIGFSAHAPVAWDSDWHLPMERFAEYCAMVNAAKKKWMGRLRVYLGLEADYVEGEATPGQWDREKYGLDYVIGSVHYVPTPKGALLTVDGSRESFQELVYDHFAGNAAEVARVYFDCVEKMTLEGGFDILGHFDLVKKNNRDRVFFSFDDPVYQKAVARTALFVAQAQKIDGFAVEVNTGAIARETYPDTYPSAAILRHLSGVPFIITTDAHHPDHLGTGYDRAIANMREAGCGESAFFEGHGTDGKPRWSFAPLATNSEQHQP
ncbi:MAG: histidinol-phosphatase [Spirochaetaceae bacterium]|jgi:histidinol-phosphatase (PHP family)|nr:histidinol-phosphatase [Spirochaetaceae bacterium]